MDRLRYFEILGVDRNATKEEVRRAFRRLASRYHPDRNRSSYAEKRFREISEAYAELSNEEKNRQHDAFKDTYEDLDACGMRSAQSGVHLSCELEIDLEDVYRGRTVEIDVPRAETCRTCNGNGAKPSTSVKECPECRGAGHVGLLEASSSEDLFQVTFCSRCGGRGTIVRKPCKECNGSGMVNKTRRTRIEVPPGVEDGGTLVVRGEGESAYENGLPGDLYIAINVRPHEVFRRVDADIIAEVPIDLTDMVFGGEVNVPTMDGYVKLKIPKGTKSGAVFRLKSKGLPIINSGSRGDELVKVRIRTSPWSILYQLIAHVTSMWNKLVGPWKILIDREQGRACLAS